MTILHMPSRDYGGDRDAHVLSALLAAADVDGEVDASIRGLRDSTGVPRQTVLRALRRLEADGSIRPLRRGTGDGYPTRWVISQD